MAMTHDKRRTEELRTVKTLDDLVEALKLRNFKLSRNAAYLRFLPKRSDSQERKRHVVTVPVRLAKATDDLRVQHSDTNFCRTSIRYLEERASIFGPQQVTFISQDDKARVPLGITAANKQSPLLMHMEYRIRLPDHDFVVAERHKLILSVYAFINVKPDMPVDASAVRYSGLTYIAIRNGKHCSSTALSHGCDIEYAFDKEEFAENCKLDDGSFKPVLIITADGGPDENPQYDKVQKVAISHFKKFNLDAIFIATNAPGRSAYNRVERRMAPLSKELGGVILPYDHFGSHLDDNCKTVAEELEKQNFQQAGQVLAEILSQVVLDSCPIIAEYIPPMISETSEHENDGNVTQKWRRIHVREGHYYFQVMKCDDILCCSPMRGSIRKILPRFIPAPLAFVQNPLLAFQDELNDKSGCASLVLRLLLNDAKFQQGNISEVPFDISCLSLKHIIPKRCCTLCGLYHASQKSMKSHLKYCKNSEQAAPTGKDDSPVDMPTFPGRPLPVAAKRQREKMLIWTTRLNDLHADWVDDEEMRGLIVPGLPSSVVSEVIPIINIEEHMSNPWKDL